jgi:O-antigen/teichoic acid export membrane protein
MSANERIATVTALAVAGLALSLVIGPPLVWAFLAVLIVTVAVGTEQVLRRHPRATEREFSLAVFVLPCLIVLGSFAFLRIPALARGGAVAAVLGLTGLVLAGALYGEYLTFDRSSPTYRPARLALNLIAYVIAFALFSAIFAPKVRSLLSATAVLLASALIAAELFRGAGRAARHPLWVAVVAVTLAQVTWALNYWVLGALAGGAILLLVFYTVTGLIRSHLNGTLAPLVLTEHLVVAGAGFAAVIAGGLWLR